MYFLGSHSEYGSSHYNWIQLVERGKKSSFVEFSLYVGTMWVKMMSIYNEICSVKLNICDEIEAIIHWKYVLFLNKTVHFFQYKVFDNLIC